MTRPLPRRFAFPAQFPETQPRIMAREDDKRQCRRRKMLIRALIAVWFVTLVVVLVA